MESNLSEYSDFLIELTNISPRRGLLEQTSANLIKKYLDKNNVNYIVQEFDTKIPTIKKAELFADGIKIPCLGASFVSGKIDNTSVIVNATGPIVEKSMIIFNPVSLGVCLQNFKKQPAISVNRDSIIQLTMANDIKGDVDVEEYKFISQNILVGNIKNPQNIIFAHYDSLIGGAVDNAGSVEVIFQILVQNKDILVNNLFVFVGSEEESISSNEGLWGFKNFDLIYHKLLLECKKIIVLDGVGIGTPNFVSHHIDWVFAVNSDEASIYSKTIWMQNDQTLVMKYYHSSLDTIDLLKSQYLDEAKDLLINKIS